MSGTDGSPFGSANAPDPAPAYLAIGHATRDVLADGSTRLGGAASYASLAASRLGVAAAIVTRCEPSALDEHALPGVLRAIQASDRTTTFVNRYDANGARRQVLVDVSPPISRSDVPVEWRGAGIVHLASVVHEIPADIVRVVSDRAFVGVTPQGWLRDLAVGQEVRAREWVVPEEIARRADAVVVSAEDLAGERRGVGWLARRVRILVVTDGPRGATAFWGGGSAHEPALPADVVDPTGAGDVFAAALFIRLRECGDVRTALRFGAAAAACAIEAWGVDGIVSRQAVEERLRRG